MIIPVFVGYDRRESSVFHTFSQSVINTASVPVSIIPLHKGMLGNFDGQRDGTNAFIYSRFLVPYLMDFKGWALYCDSDMLFRTDIIQLWDRIDESKAVMVVKHRYETTQHRKFIGTPIEADNATYPRKNWSSMILWNCGHPQNRVLSKSFVKESGGRILHRFSWLKDELIGSIPVTWNHLVNEYEFKPDANLVHFTLGAPGFSHYKNCDYSAEWNETLLDVNHMIGEDPTGMVRRAQDV